VATIEGFRQVLFATTGSLISLERDTGNLLWTYPYPFDPVDTAMGASAVAYSNLVFITAAYGARGAAAARITRNGSTWTADHLWFKTSQNGVTFKSTWMTPVCYDGHIYGLFGDKSWTNSPLNCIELATGQLKWSMPNFGMGGIIVVNTNLLVATEDGQLVLLHPNSAAYSEVTRFRAFTFTPAGPGKVWNSPAYSNGRIYLRSTRGGISLDVSPPPPPTPLRFLPPQPISSTAFRLFITTSNGTPISSTRLAGIELRATNTPNLSPGLWPKLTIPLSLTSNGLAIATNTVSSGRSQSFYITVERSP
jgi:outer membrane protein assembly factor BamB